MNERRLVLPGRALVMMTLLAASACAAADDEPAVTAESRTDADSALSDPERLLACEAEEPCSESEAQLADGRPYGITQSTACLLEGLQARTPGRYRHGNNRHHAQGEDGVDHVLIVRADGSALYARTRYMHPSAGDRTQAPASAQLCTLRDPSYFAECAAAVRQVQPRMPIAELPWACAFGEGGTQPGELKWFERCEDAPAVCE